MAVELLVDTSVLKRVRRAEVRMVVEPLASAGKLGRATISDLEVGYSARNESEWDLLVASLDAFVKIEVRSRHFERALQVQRLLASRSQRGRKIPDLLIAAVAEAMDIGVLHYDADFDRIAEVTGQASEWVVAQGTLE